MSHNCYDPNKDKLILEILEKDGKTTFSNLLTRLQISSRTLSKHLKFLRKKEIITREEKGTGFRSFIELTHKTKMKIKYGIHEIDYSNERGICKEWREQDKIDITKKRKRKLILFLLAISYGYRGYKIPSKPQKGMILVKNKDGKQIGISLYSEEGFSPSDLNRDDSFSAFQDLILWNRFTEKDMKQIIDDLEKNEHIQFKKLIGKNGEIRYELKDEVLKQFLIWYASILKRNVMIMRRYWYILSEIPKGEQRKWFSDIVGNEKATNFFLQIDHNQAIEKTIEDLYREYELLHSNYFIDPKYVESVIAQMKKKSEEIFTRREIRKELFNQASEEIRLGYSLDIYSKDKKVQKLMKAIQIVIKEPEYEWIMDELKYIKLVKEPKYQWQLDKFKNMIYPIFLD